MIRKDDLLPIGKIVKPHGIHGEMTFEYSSDVFDRESVPFLMMEVDGIIVPFNVENYRIRSSSTALLKLKGVGSDDQARLFSGTMVYVPSTYLLSMNNSEVESSYFTGFQMIDQRLGVIGVIAELDETTENALFVIPKDDDELLIPATDAYIVAIDHVQRIITVDLPEGLV